MSGAVGILGVSALVALETVTFRPLRALGPIIPQCAVEERHSDRLIITEHPVEQNASISDHAYKLPAEVVLRYGWSDSGNGEGFSNFIYGQLLILQEKRQPFTLHTGKRIYQSMLIQSIEQTTDQTSEHALMVTVTCKQVIIVTTQSVNIPKSDNKSLAPTEPGGTTTPEPKEAPPKSILDRMAGNTRAGQAIHNLGRGSGP